MPRQPDQPRASSDQQSAVVATEPRSTTAPGVDGELMPQRQVLEDEIAAGADRSEECCDKQTEVEHRRASRGSPILCYLRTDLHGSSFAVPRDQLTTVAVDAMASQQRAAVGCVPTGPAWADTGLGRGLCRACVPRRSSPLYVHSRTRRPVRTPAERRSGHIRLRPTSADRGCRTVRGTSAPRGTVARTLNTALPGDSAEGS